MSAKICEKCGFPYYRRNKMEIWTGRNPGHRLGWNKQEIKVCNTCLPQIDAQRMLVRMDLRITKTGKVLKVRPRRKREVAAG